MPVSPATTPPTAAEPVRRPAGDDASKPPPSLDDIMKQWLINDFKQAVMFPDPDDPAACPTFDGNGTW
ncbi:hypothetical protein [Burkholderia alba]|uniref:hypothetical protein n=1 Tax=Burkholderia alba TaxID=2683677 RepID=UPI0038993CB3